MRVGRLITKITVQHKGLGPIVGWIETEREGGDCEVWVWQRDGSISLDHVAPTLVAAVAWMERHGYCYAGIRIDYGADTQHKEDGRGQGQEAHV